MNGTIMNPEFKSIAIKLLILQIIFAVIFSIFTGFELKEVNKNIVSNNTALIGTILNNHPEYESQIVKYVTKGADSEEIETGRKILSRYGYADNISDVVDSSMRNSYNSVKIFTAILSLLFFIPLIIVVYIGYGGMYKKVRKIYCASEEVMKGNFNSILPENSEGDFAILGSTFNSMAGRLKLSINALENEKLLLKNTMSDISHQLKTPLSSIIAMNDIMIEHKNMSDEERSGFLHRSSLQLTRMEWLIMNLLKAARLEAGAIKFNMKKTLLINPVDSAIVYLKSMIDIKSQKVTVESTGENISFIGDEDWVSEALANIIKNSIEHTKSGGNIHIRLSSTSVFSRIEIEDEGEGISKEDLPHIFERFYKGSNSVKPESIGIGLALSKLIIEGQNGNIYVRSEIGKGTEFIITFLKGII